MEQFVDELTVLPPGESVLATILFTDIVGSSELAARLGDRRWADLIEQHHAAVRKQLRLFRGTEIDIAGDGFFARFDGPARAIRCGVAIRDVLSELELDVRVGIHTGECALVGGSRLASQSAQVRALPPRQGQARCWSRRQSRI
jgi:class 3 adenylate cyclase